MMRDAPVDTTPPVRKAGAFGPRRIEHSDPTGHDRRRRAQQRQAETRRRALVSAWLRSLSRSD
jgi:hypothetical protein